LNSINQIVFNSAEIVKTIGYFDYFKYPLKKEQILHFLNVKIENIETLEFALEDLIKEQKVQKKDDFYSLQNIDQYVANRIKGEHRFTLLEERIGKSCKRISKFPFVKFVGISGSLSKGYASENADIDFFIITSKNRLWICRTILHLFKKLSFLKGSEHWYCMNYFIDETAIEIEEQNYFTAIELTTLMPMTNEQDFYQSLIDKNLVWIQPLLPNYTFVIPSNRVKLQNKIWNRIAEFFSSDALNKRLMNWTDKKWRNKWKKKNYPDEDYELAFKTRINISKNHLHNYQKKLLAHLEKIS
jgi:predicted nucleotidyltransferase